MSEQYRGQSYEDAAQSIMKAAAAFGKAVNSFNEWESSYDRITKIIREADKHGNE